MLSVRKIVDQLLGRRVPHQKLSVIGRILNDPDWSESKTESLLCNLSEAARRLGCSRSRFWQLRKQGVIPTVMLEGVRYVRSQDLDDIVRKLEHSEVTA
jgi:predicted DNA-binding transcriptional regulator AlpA